MISPLTFGQDAPDTTLTGHLAYQAASVTSPVDSLTSVDLTIAGHTYTLAELGSKTIGPYNLIGSTSAGLGVVTAGVDSFYLQYNPILHDPVAFLYSAASFPSIVDAVSYPRFSISAAAAAPAPEASAWSLLLTGFLAAGGLAVRRRLRREAA